MKSARFFPMFSAFVIGTLVFACGDDDAVGGARCGNGIVEGMEACDGFELRGASCQTEGLGGGRLKCAADCKLDTSECWRCGDNKLNPDEACDGTDLGGKTCADIAGPGATGTLACAPDCHSFDSTACIFDAPKPVLTACDPAAPNACEAGLTCLKTPSGNFCLTPCDPNTASTCGAGKACERLDATTGACVALPGTGETCRPATGCLDVANTCIATFGPAGAATYTCAPTCSAKEANQGQGRCAVGKTCAPSQSSEVELDGTGPCSPTASTCDGANGYTCRSVMVNGIAENRCARDYALCAERLPLYPFNGQPVPQNMICDRKNPSQGNKMCALAGGAAGPLANPAKVECYPYFDPIGELGVCVATCDAAEINGGAGGDADCGIGSACGVPPEPELFTAPTPTQPCVSSPTVCGGQYPNCVDLGGGPECARPLKICIPQ